MQEGRDHENESPERDSAPSPPGEPAAPSAGSAPQAGESPGASWVPFSMTSPEDPPAGQAPPAGQTVSGEPAGAGTQPTGQIVTGEPAGAGTQPTGPAGPVPPAAGEQPGSWPGQPGYPPPGYAQPGYAQPGYAQPGYGQPGYGQPGYGPRPEYGPPQYTQPPHSQPQYGPPPGEPGSPWQAQPGTQPIWVSPAQGQQGWGPPPTGGPYGTGQGGTWPPYPAELPGGTPPAGQWAPPPGGGYGPPLGQPPSRGPAGRAMVYVLVAVLAAAIGAGAVFALRGQPGNTPAVTPQDAPKPHTNTSGRGTGTPGINLGAVSRKVEPGMVDIVSRLKLTGQIFEGTGMILTSSGLVLTNNHVIDGATVGSLRARDVGNGRTYTAQIVGWDEAGDVALIKLVGASGLKTVHTGNSAGVTKGQTVVALGNAGGTGGNPTVTSGKITNVNQNITASDAGSDTSEKLYGMLQTSAPIQPGDSGGPLVTTAGRVIGMDTAANPQTSGQGYAIPINRALSVVRQITAGHNGGVIHLGEPPFIGIAIASTANNATSTATSPRVQWRQLKSIARTDGGVNSSGKCLPNEVGSPVPGSIAPATSGALVGGVFCNTPANTAGLQAGDVIVGVNGHTVNSATTLHSAIGNYRPGNTVSLTWVQLNGQKHTGSLTLAAGPVH
jgi:S1-C subfamily serine protease